MAMQQPGAVRLGPPPREDSGSSSRMESYMGDEPTFDSARGSSSSGASELQDLPPPAAMVTVVWKKMSVAYPKGCSGGKRIILHWVSGFAEPRSVLAIVGPANAGKSALVCALGNRIYKPARMYGEILINGLPPKRSPIQPTFFDAADEPLMNVTVELALLYTAQLRVRSPHKGAVESEVRKICQQLGLLNDLDRLTNKLDAGLQRRLSVACQLVGAGPLLVLHDVLQGVHEGDALAIMRTIHERAREGATAIVVCQQPTTDICSFFTRAFVLCTGEVVYFGETGAQAMQLLASSGMPCPPLYSPLEQFMRLVDPSFEVYLQVAQPGGSQDWNTRFSGMMFKVLQDAYVNSPVFSANQDQNVALMGRRLDSPPKSPPAHPNAFKQFFTICQRMVSQGLRCFPLFLVRIIIGALLSVVYAASYSNQGYTLTAATERGFIFMLVTGILPLLTLTSLPIYFNTWKVYKRERLSCGIGLMTQLLAMFTIIVPHVAVQAVVQAVIFVPWVNLNTTGSGWGYFILIVFLVNMLADILCLLIAATFLKLLTQTTIILIFMVAQILGATFFAGTRRGIQVPLNGFSYVAWGYRGLVNNEFVDSDHTFTCTDFGGTDCVPLSSQQIASIVQNGFGGRTLWGYQRWHAVWVLLGMYGFWAICLIALLVYHLILRRSQKMHLALEPPEAKLQIMESANDMGGMPNGHKHPPPTMNGHNGDHAATNGTDHTGMNGGLNGDSRV